MSDNGRVTTRIPAETTDRLALGLVAASKDMGLAPPHESDDTLKQLLRAVKTAVEKGGGGGDGPPPKVFLGQDSGFWLKLAISALVAVSLSLGAWFLAIRDGFAERPTSEAVGKMFREYDKHHSDHPHPVTAKRLSAVENEQKLIRESQIRQEALAEVQTQTLTEIKGDLKQLRRRLNR